LSFQKVQAVRLERIVLGIAMAVPVVVLPPSGAAGDPGGAVVPGRVLVGSAPRPTPAARPLVRRLDARPARDRRVGSDGLVVHALDESDQVSSAQGVAISVPATASMAPAELGPDGQFLVSTGALGNVTVTDTRVADPGWTLSASVIDVAGTS